MELTNKFLNERPNTLELLRTLLMHTPMGVQVYDAEGFSLYMNESCRRIFGSTPPPDYNVFKDEVAIAAGYGKLLKRAFAGERTKSEIFWYDTRELKHVKIKEGRRCAIQTHLVPVPDQDGKVKYVIFFHQDVTAQVFIEQERTIALKERDDARIFVQNILDQTQSIIFIKDLAGKLLFINSRFRQIFHLSDEEALGKTDSELFGDKIAGPFRENDRVVIEQQKFLEVEETAEHPDGTINSYLSVKFPLRDSTGEIIGLCGISTDISQFKAAERELNAAKRIQSLGLMAGGMAHNFNNLLSIILLTADTLLLRQNIADKEGRSAIEAIRKTAYNASLLTRQLLTFGRREIFQPSLIDLRSTFSSLREILTNAIGENIKFTVDISEKLWPIVADPAQIEQVFINLCMNARDAIGTHGEIKLTLKNESLPAGRRWWRIGKPAGEYVELSVSDTGCGMDRDALEKLFQPFYTTKKEMNGTGLGLATVYGILEAAGGDISVESKPAKGSTFSLYFPRSEGVSLESNAFVNEAQPPYVGKGCILLVEDEDALRHVTASLLRQHGYSVVEAKDGKVALELWPKLKKSLDLLITDLVMPELSGAELAQKIMAGASRSLKVIYTSAYSNQVTPEIIKRDSAQFLQKPHSAHELLKKIHECLNSSTS